jgi:hypothetical protein
VSITAIIGAPSAADFRDSSYSAVMDCLTDATLCALLLDCLGPEAPTLAYSVFTDNNLAGKAGVTLTGPGDRPLGMAPVIGSWEWPR